MKDLYLHEDAIYKTSSSKPKSSSKLAWLKVEEAGDGYFSKWLGLTLNSIYDHSSGDLQLKPGVGRISSHSKSHYLKVNLGYEGTYEQLDDQVQLSVPKSHLILPKSSCSDICDLLSLLDEPKKTKKECVRPRRVNNTVYVDAVYGNDSTGQLENPQLPFRTIQAAINTIPPLPLPAFEGCPEQAGWLVRVSPGVYEESLVIPHLIRVLGSGLEQTIIRGIPPIPGVESVPAVTFTSVGFNSVEELTICGAPTPLVSFELTSPTGGELGVATLSEVEVNSIPLPFLEEFSIISLSEPIGINGVGEVLNSRIRVDAQAVPGAQINVFSSSEIETRVSNSNISLIGTPGSRHSIVNAGGRFTLQGGLTRFQIVDAVPTVPNLLFQANEANLNISGHSVVALNTALVGGEGVPVTFFTTSVGTINVNNVDINSDGIPQELQRLAQTNFEVDVINMLSLQFPSTFVPSVSGPGDINYFSNSNGGNVIGSGGPYTNIRIVETNDFVQDDDHTIIGTIPGITISFPNPTEVNEEVLYLGKQTRVVNTSGGDITLNGAINGGDITLADGTTADLQATAEIWYSVGVYPNN